MRQLRLDVDNPADGNEYGVSGNPFVGVAGHLPEIYALGLRNPWRYDNEVVGGCGAGLRAVGA